MRTSGVRRDRPLRQRTLKNSIHCSGIGLHSGAKVNMTLHPADPDHGIMFRRTDLADPTEIRATWDSALETPMCTSLGIDGESRVGTIEHLMSALAGCGIDNAVVELNGPEVPVMDGSAAPFVFLIECAGTLEQAASRRALLIRKTVTVSQGDRFITVSPGPGFSIGFEIDFDNAVVARQEWSLQVSPASYKREISRARTFGFLHEANRLREMGLARGASLDNAVVISDEHILNDGGLRYDNEFVRHKVLDLIGDLYLVGAPIIGAVHGVRAGHALTVRLLKTLFADQNAWAWREMTEADTGAFAGPSIPPARAVAASA